MAKLKDGEKVIQTFVVITSFKAQAGDTRFKAADIKAYVREGLDADDVDCSDVKVTVQEDTTA